MGFHNHPRLFLCLYASVFLTVPQARDPYSLYSSFETHLGVLQEEAIKGMDRNLKRGLSSILETFERIAYLTLALALSVPIVMLVISAVMSMLEVAEVGVLQTALAVLDSLLLAFIFVELIETIRVVTMGTERGIFIAEPFLVVGLVAVVRSILRLIANLKQLQSIQESEILLIELGILTLLVIVLTSGLYFTRRMRLSEKKPDTCE